MDDKKILRIDIIYWLIILSGVPTARCASFSFLINGVLACIHKKITHGVLRSSAG